MSRTLALLECAFYIILHVNLGLYIEKEVLNVMLINHIERMIIEVCTEASVRKRTVKTWGKEFLVVDGLNDFKFTFL